MEALVVAAIILAFIWCIRAINTAATGKPWSGCAGETVVGGCLGCVGLGALLVIGGRILIALGPVTLAIVLVIVLVMEVLRSFPGE